MPEMHISRQTVCFMNIHLYRTVSLQPLDDDSLETRASAFQRSIGVADACTYRLIAKNVTLLLVPSQQRLKEETLKQLEELIK